MKKLIFLVTFFLFLGLSPVFDSAHGATVQGAGFDPATNRVYVDVRIFGGCKEHSFWLELSQCDYRLPIDCQMNLIHEIQDGSDPCYAYFDQRLQFSASDLGLDHPIYWNGTFSVRGEQNSCASFVKPQ